MPPHHRQDVSHRAAKRADAVRGSCPRAFGLGLTTIAEQWASRMRGTAIELQSRVGEGSTVWL